MLSESNLSFSREDSTYITSAREEKVFPENSLLFKCYFLVSILNTGTRVTPSLLSESSTI